MLMGWGAEKTWTLCNPCSGIAKTSLCYQLFSAQILSTAPDQILWRKFSLSQPKSAQFPGNLYLDSVKKLIKSFTRSRALLVTNKFLWDRAWSLCASPVPWLSLQYLCNSPQRQSVSKDNQTWRTCRPNPSIHMLDTNFKRLAQLSVTRKAYPCGVYIVQLLKQQGQGDIFSYIINIFLEVTFLAG